MFLFNHAEFKVGAQKNYRKHPLSRVRGNENKTWKLSLHITDNLGVGPATCPEPYFMSQRIEIKFFIWDILIKSSVVIIHIY